MSDTNETVKETGVNHDEEDEQQQEEETWLYENNKAKDDEIIDNTATPLIDEIAAQEMDVKENTTTTTIPIAISSISNQVDEDSDSDDDGIKITIGNYDPDATNFQINRRKNRGMLSGVPIMASKLPTTRGIDLDAQGVINGKPTYEYDILNAYKDEEKPWKKPGADIVDYFNYGFTEEVWAQYCNRQRQLSSDNNLARLNPVHNPHMPPMHSDHSSMMHTMNNPHPMMMMNRPQNLQMMTRPMNNRKSDGRIDVIGATDQTSRRQMLETLNNFEHHQFVNGSSLQVLVNSHKKSDLISSPQPASNNGPSPSHGTFSGTPHHIPQFGLHRLPMMPVSNGMPFRPPFGHLHRLGGPQFYPHGPPMGMHGDRLQRPYFVPHYPQQPWDNTGRPPMHRFPLETIGSANSGNEHAPYNRSPAVEDHLSRTSTPEENRANGESGATIGDIDEASKNDRYKERYRNDQDYQSPSARDRPPSKDRSSSSYHTHRRSREHEYERPKNDRKSSKDRDDKYERYSRKRHHKDDSSHQHQGTDESTRIVRSSHRTPTKDGSSPSNDISQQLNKQPEIIEIDATPSSTNRLRRDDSERSSSRHNHHKKSSKRSRHDSDNERSNSQHHR
ncbi:unnamed protein product [Adineta steineri]|uniref:Pre-mRNA polyadenylation factor Fip1 domain-containing protein n=1 Tax=Adineta steineri TaxID=433720 RepID=A0A818U999_9BILA|nr:unnamed protein product [Adineta steineri]